MMMMKTTPPMTLLNPILGNLVWQSPPSHCLGYSMPLMVSQAKKIVFFSQPRMFACPSRIWGIDDMQKPSQSAGPCHSPSRPV